MKSSTGREILKYTGSILLVFSAGELIIDLLQIMRNDMAAVGYGGALEELFAFRAGNIAVQVLIAIVGIAAGYAGMALSGKERYNSYLNWFGTALMVIYVLEALILIKASGTVWAWIRVILLFISAALYWYGAFLNGKVIEQELNKAASQH